MTGSSIWDNTSLRTSLYPNVHFFHSIYHTADITDTIKPKQNTPAELLELVSKEHVSEEDLSDNVSKVEELAGKEFEEVSSSLCLLLVEIPEV